MTQAGYIQLIADSSSLPKAEKDLDSLAKTSERTERRVRPSMDSVSDSTKRVGTASGQQTMALRNLAQQLNQVGQQASVTGNFMGALAVQLPDILGGSGSLPLIIAGAAVGLSTALIPALVGSGESASDFEDALDELDAQLRAVQDSIEGLSTSSLRELFGDASEDARELARSGLDISLRRQADAARALSEALNQEYNGNGFLNISRRDELYAEFGLVGELTQRIANGLDAVGRAQGIDEQVEAAAALRETLLASFGPIEDMTAEQLALYVRVDETERAWRRVRASVQDATNEQGAAARQQIADAQTLIERNQQNADLMIAIAQHGENSAEADAVRREQAMAATEAYIEQNQLTGDIAAQLRASAAATFDAETGARAAAASLSEAEQAARALASAMAAAAGFSVGIEGQIATVRAQIDALRSGQDATTAGRVESLRQEAAARRDAVLAAADADETARVAAEERYQADLQNIDVLGQEMTALREIQQVQRQGGASVRREHNEAMREAERVIESIRTETEQYAAELADLNDLRREGYLTEEQHARAVAMVRDEYLGLEEIQDTLKDAILDFADGGEDAMDNLGRAIRRAALEALLFGEGPLGQLFGGGGLLSGLLGGITGGLRIGAGKATGGRVAPGTLYPVNENTTNTEWFAPDVAGTVFTASQVQGMAGRPSGNTIVNIANSTGQPVETRESTDANGDRQVDVMIGRSIGRGRQDGAMRRFGAQPKVLNR